MEYSTSKLCDLYPEYIDVVEPIFANFGSRAAFFGQLVIIKSFEDITLVRSTLASDGEGKVLLIDGGGSLRCALLDAELANLACVNNWEGVIVYGCVRDVDELEQVDIGIQALASIPVLAPEMTNYSDNVDIPVTLGGVTFLPEDYIYADNTGVILSPDDLLDEENLANNWEEA